MPGTTPGGALPYPLPDEPVKDGAQRVMELAEKLVTSEWLVFRAEDQNVPTGVWTNVGPTSTPVSRGAGYLQGGGLGVTVLKAGRYLVHATAVISPSGAGRRGITVHTSAAPPFSVAQPLGPASPSQQHTMAMATILQCAAGSSYGVFVFQDSGTTQLVSSSRLNFYRLT
jgi:hypothetical protein